MGDDKVWIIRDIDSKTLFSLKFKIEDLKDIAKIDKDADTKNKKYKELLNADKEYFQVFTIPTNSDKTKDFGITFRQRSINFLNIKVGKEMPLVALNSAGAQDLIFNG